MPNTSFADFTHQYNRLDMAFFDLMRSIAELHANQHVLSVEELEQVQIGARILNGILAKMPQ